MSTPSRPGLRRLGRRRPLDQPDARAAPRRLRPPRGGPRGLGRRRLDLPRPRLPPPAQPCPLQVPRRRLGRREVPRGAGEGLPRPALQDGPAPAPRPDTVATTSASTGRSTAGATSAWRRWPAGQRRRPGRVAELAEAHGSGRVRLTTHQKIVVLDVPGAGGRPGGRSRRGRISSRPTEFRRGTMACTGIEFCKLAIVETKARAGTVVEELERRLPGGTADVHPRERLPQLVRPLPGRRHRPQGPRRDRRRRRAVEGFQVHLGGGLGNARWRARPVSCASPRTTCPTTSSGSAAAPRAAHRPDESFAAWARRAEEEALR